MEFVRVSKEDRLATLTLCRGKVNALNEPMIDEISRSFSDLETDDSVGGIVLSGTGKFFSFGFDIPEFLSYSREEFTRYLKKFSDLYTRIYLYPKPVVAALNGHTVAGGCMLTLACDFRIMVTGKAKISLNEITFGASVFAGSVEILKRIVGQRNAERILLTGSMYSAEEAHRMGLVDEAVDEARLQERVREIATALSAKDPAPYKSIKELLRKPVIESAAEREERSIREFVDIWYSERTWKKVQEVKIHS